MLFKNYKYEAGSEREDLDLDFLAKLKQHEPMTSAVIV